MAPSIKKISFAILLFTTAVLTINAHSDSSYKTNYQFGIHINPVIGWFGSNTAFAKNTGSRPGINAGIEINKYLAPNYALSVGINMTGSGGKLNYSDTTSIYSASNETEIPPNTNIIYRVQYLSFPVGMKLQTKQMGSLRIFSNLGVDPKIAIDRKIDLPYFNMTKIDGTKELNIFNMGFHINAGIEYCTGKNTAFVFGLNFENNFFDVTKEIHHQKPDKITHRLLSFQLGFLF